MAAALAATTILLFADNLIGAKKPKETPPAEAAAPTVPKPDIPDLEFITRLREEEFGHGEVMDIMSHLTDDIGPRLTGSPNMKKANEWTRDQFAKWGLVNAHLEAWALSVAVGRTNFAKFACSRPTSCNSWRCLRPGRRGRMVRSGAR